MSCLLWVCCVKQRLWEKPTSQAQFFPPTIPLWRLSGFLKCTKQQSHMNRSIGLIHVLWIYMTLSRVLRSAVSLWWTSSSSAGTAGLGPHSQEQRSHIQTMGLMTRKTFIRWQLDGHWHYQAQRMKVIWWAIHLQLPALLRKRWFCRLTHEGCRRFKTATGTSN